MTTNAQTTKVPIYLYAILGLVVLFLICIVLGLCTKHFDEISVSSFGAGSDNYQKNDVKDYELSYTLMGMERRDRKKNQWQIMVVLNRNSQILFNTENGWSVDDKPFNILFRNSIIMLDKDYHIRKERIISYEEYLMIKNSPSKYIEDFINKLNLKKEENKAIMNGL